MSRAFAVQGNCYVIAVCGMLRPDDVPEPYRDLVSEKPDDVGGSCIIAPGGDVLTAAPPQEEAIVTATVSLEAVLQGKGVIDVGAHYSRPDVLQLHVNRRPIESLNQDLDMGYSTDDKEQQEDLTDS
jgi:predicted amidohydrolase